MNTIYAVLLFFIYLLFIIIYGVEVYRLGKRDGESELVKRLLKKAKEVEEKIKKDA